MTDFDLTRVRAHIGAIYRHGDIHNMTHLASHMATDIANLRGERDAAIATIALLRAGRTDFDLEATLAEIRAYAGDGPNLLVDVAVQLAMQLHGKTAGREADLIALADQLTADLDDLGAAYTRTVRQINEFHAWVPGTLPADRICEPNCGACEVLRDVPADTLLDATGRVFHTIEIGARQ